MAKKKNVISMKEARDVQAARSAAAQKRDDCEFNKNVLKKPTTGWAGAPGKSDVLKIDMPTQKVKGHTRKGKKVKAYARKGKLGPECTPPAK